MFSLDVMTNKICTNATHRFNVYTLNMIPSDLYNYQTGSKKNSSDL